MMRFWREYNHLVLYQQKVTKPRNSLKMLFSPYRKCLNSKKASKSNSRRLFVFLGGPFSAAPMLIPVGNHQIKIVGCIPQCPNFWNVHSSNQSFNSRSVLPIHFLGLL